MNNNMYRKDAFGLLVSLFKHSVGSVRRVLLMCSVTLASVLFAGMPAIASEEATPYQVSEDQMADVDAVLRKARESGKLALFIMGANWCHDSQAMARIIGDPALQPVLAEHYEVLLVDVGLLAKGAEVIQRFGMPVIYGTPTVLIVEPETEQLLNREDLSLWYGADSVSMDKAAAHLRAKAAPAVRKRAFEALATGQLKTLLDEIDTFEVALSKRVYDGFKVVGPMVGLDEKDLPKNFYSLWIQLRDLRFQIPKDLIALRAEAYKRVRTGEMNIILTYPKYDLLEWERS